MPQGHKIPSQSSTFIYCEFNSLSYTDSGGAVSFSSSSSTLTISDSIFTFCTSSVFGGPIYATNCGLVTLHRISYISCSCSANKWGGGAVLIYDVPIMPEITDNCFISCASRVDGGGLDLRSVTASNLENIPVKGCKFISCVANGDIGESRIDADGGGLIFWTNHNTLGFSDSLFAKCESKTRAGGSFVTINADYFDYIIRFCFYCENIAQIGTNSLIHFNSTDGEPWNSVFFRSFTSDADITKSLVKSYYEQTLVSDNWLPLPSIYAALRPVPNNNPDDTLFSVDNNLKA